MADRTKIEWCRDPKDGSAGATWNPITGCSVASPGCTNCYAMRLAGTRLADHPSRAGLTKEVNGNHVWTGEVRLNEYWLYQPIRWNKPRMIFVCAHGDLFHESVPVEWIVQVFAVMIAAPQHTYQVLTKRSARMRQVMQWLYETEEGSDALVEAVESFAPETDLDFTVPPEHIWMGVSAEDQQRWDERVENLRDTPAAVRWVSAEPLIGPIMPNLAAIDWVVVGGESGPGARPMHPDWARDLLNACYLLGVPFLFKQWGSYQVVFDRDHDDPDWRNCSQWERKYPKGRWLNLAGGTGFHGERVVYVTPVGKSQAGRLLDGVEHNGYPR